MPKKIFHSMFFMILIISVITFWYDQDKSISQKINAKNQSKQAFFKNIHIKKYDANEQVFDLSSQVFTYYAPQKMELDRMVIGWQKEGDKSQSFKTKTLIISFLTEGFSKILENPQIKNLELLNGVEIWLDHKKIETKACVYDPKKNSIKSKDKSWFYEGKSKFIANKGFKVDLKKETYKLVGEVTGVISK